MILTVLLIGGVIFLRRGLGGTAVISSAEEEEQGYHLNDSLLNAFSDLPEMERMERYIERWMQRNGIQGASLAVMQDEHLIYGKGFGWADKEREREAEVGDIYRIASASLSTELHVMEVGYNRTPKGLHQIMKREVYILHYVTAGCGTFCGEKFDIRRQVLNRLPWKTTHDTASNLISVSA